MNRIYWIFVAIGLAVIGALVYAGIRDSAGLPFLIAACVLAITAKLAHLILTGKDRPHEALPEATDRPEQHWLPELPPEGTAGDSAASDGRDDDSDLPLHDPVLSGGRIHRHPFGGLTASGSYAQALNRRDNEIFRLRDALRQLDGYAVSLSTVERADVRRIAGAISNVTRPILEERKR